VVSKSQLISPLKKRKGKADYLEKEIEKLKRQNEIDFKDVESRKKAQS